MKKILSIMMLICIGLSAYAINYPTFKPNPRDRQMQQMQQVQRQEAPTIGGYSTVATGGMTTTGEGSAVSGPASGPRRAQWGGVGTPNVGDTDGNGHVWNGSTWVDDEEETDENPNDPQPVGSPMVMLLFAAAACGAIYLRRRNAQA